MIMPGCLTASTASCRCRNPVVWHWVHSARLVALQFGGERGDPAVEVGLVGLADQQRGPSVRYAGTLPVPSGIDRVALLVADRRRRPRG